MTEKSQQFLNLLHSKNADLEEAARLWCELEPLEQARLVVHKLAEERAREEKIARHQELARARAERRAAGGEPTRKPVGYCPYEQMTEAYNRILVPGMRKCNKYTTRRVRLAAMWEHMGEWTKKAGADSTGARLNMWERYLKKAAESDFLMGKIPGWRGTLFQGDIDFVIRESTYVALTEGKYANRETI